MASLEFPNKRQQQQQVNLAVRFSIVKSDQLNLSFSFFRAPITNRHYYPPFYPLKVSLNEFAFQTIFQFLLKLVNSCGY